ncbi:LysR family transcriptional regulator, partial [Klebsiella pneumoniae]
MELQDIDLNLLVVFNELLRQRRVSAVAETLGISQPAISNALNRMRKLFG